MRKLVYFSIATLLFLGVNTALTAQTASVTAKGDLPEIEIANFENVADKHVDNKVSVKGTVVHVCKHGGKRMFLMGDDPNVRVKITKGKNMTAFEREMEGSDVSAEGIVRVKEVDNAYLDQWEQDVKANIKESSKKIHTGEEGHEEHEGEAEETLKKIKNMRSQLKKSGKEALTFYSLECTDYKVLD